MNLLIKRSTIILSAIAMFTLAATTWKKVKAKTMATLDPLENLVGITREELTLYRYLMALEALSTYGRSAPNLLSAETIKQYIEENPAAKCVTCERWFLAEVAHCPYCHIQTREVAREDIMEQAQIWETFRQRYAETTRIRGLTRVTTIKIHYLLGKADQR